MARPRLYGEEIPAGVRLISGRYYYQPTTLEERQSRKERGLMASVPLGADKELLEGKLKAIGVFSRITRRTVREMASALFYSSRANARTRGIEHAISIDQIAQLIDDTNGLCLVTGVPLDLQLVRKDRQPWTPSIDRIERRLGYIQGNCRIVCMAANFAMNKWGESILKTMLRHYAGVKNCATFGIVKPAIS